MTKEGYQPVKKVAEAVPPNTGSHVKMPEDREMRKAVQLAGGLILPKDLLGLWEQTICEIRAEIKVQDTPALVYAKELCDKLEHSMCSLAGGPYSLRYSLE